MPRSNQVLALLAAALILVHLPAALAHEEPPPTPGQPTPPADPEEPWMGHWENIHWYGTLAPLATLDHPIRGVKADGDWVVFESGGDIHLLNAYDRALVNLTSDAALQQNPAISGRYVVWEQKTGLFTDIWLYDIETDESRRLTLSPANEKSPAIHGTRVAWLDDRLGRWEVFSLDLANATSGEAPVALSDHNTKKSDVVVLEGGIVVWREITHNQWDLVLRKMPDGKRKNLTTDNVVEHPPMTDGKMLYWVKGASVARREISLQRWDPSNGTIVDLGSDGVVTNKYAFLPGNVHVGYASAGLDTISFFAINRTNGRFSVIGEQIRAGPPAWSGDALFLPVRSETHHVLLLARISPFATQDPPQLIVSRPLDGAVYFAGLVANGTYRHSPAWPQPSRFEFRVGSAAWEPFEANATWATELREAGLPEGPLTISFRVIYPEAPPVGRSISVTMRQAATNRLTLEEAAPFTLASFIERNPGLILLVVLVLLLVVLLLARFLLDRPARVRRSVEYVRPEDYP